MRKFALLCMLVMLSNISLHAVIYSTSFGGAWTDDNTWIGNVVPNYEDDVVIQGPIYIDSYVSCDSLYIAPEGSVANASDNNWRLTVNGNLVNDGVMQNGSAFTLTIITMNNVTNNGVIDVNSFSFHAESPCTVSMGPDADWSSDYLSFLSDAGAMYFLRSDVSWEFTNFTTSSMPIFMNGHNLTLSGGRLHGAVISGSGAETLTAVNGANAEQVNYSDIHLAGEHRIYTGSFTNVVNEGVLQNRSSNSSTLKFYGLFTNNGQLRNNPEGYQLHTDFYGDIVNNGAIDCYQMDLFGADTHVFTSGPDATFEVYDFSQSDDGDVSLGSSFAFAGASFAASLNLNGYDAEFSGCAVRDGQIVGTGVETVTFLNGAHTYSHSISDVYLDGEVNLGINVELQNVVNQGVMQNLGNNTYTAPISGDFVNNGTVRNNPTGWVLNLTLDSDLYNYGDWANNQIMFNSDQVHQITCGADDTLRVASMIFSGGAEMKLGSDVSIDAGVVALNGGDLLLQGHSLNLLAGELQGANIVGMQSDSVHFAPGTMIRASTATNTTISGECHVNDSNCTFVNVVNNGVLQNNSNNTQTISFADDFVNNGEVRTNPAGYVFNIECIGDIENNGVWSINQLTLVDSLPQTITQTAPMHNTNFDYNNDASFIAGSDLTFTGNDYDFNGVDIDLSTGRSMTINAFFHEATVNGGPGTVLTSNGSFWETLTLNDLTLDGVVTCSANIHLDNVVNNGVLQNRNYINYTVYTHNTFVNNGEVRDNPSSHDLYMDCEGDIVNNGLWQCYRIYLSSETGQTITATEPFEVVSVSDRDYESPTYAGSDLAFVGSSIDLNNGQLHLTGGARTGYNLTLTNVRIFDAELLGGPDTAIQADGYLRFGNLSAENIILYGELTIENGVEITNLVNNGVVQNNNGGNYTLELYGTTVNNGLFRKNPTGHNLYLDVFGDFVHNGAVSLYRFRWMGDTPQTTTIAPGSEFTLDYLYSVNSADTLYWSGDMIIHGARSNINNDRVIMGDDDNIVLDGGYVSGLKAVNGGSLTMTDDAYMKFTTIDGFDLLGEVRCRENVVLRNITVIDTLTNDPYSSSTVVLEGDCVNRGAVQSNSRNLTLEINGDFTNEGLVDIYRVNIEGATDQTISFASGGEIDCTTYIYSDIGTATWYCDGQPLGPVASSISFNAIDSDRVGLYNAEADGVWSRDVSIVALTQSQPQQPQNLLIAVDGTDVTLTWDEAPGATHYIVEAADDLNGQFAVVAASVIDANPGDGVVQWTQPVPAQTKRYYRVTAAN